MSDAELGMRRYSQGPPPSQSANLAEILERILDKGVVIAGDIAINLLDIELLTIKLRLLIASVDKAKEMGIDWWESDPSLTSKASKREDGNRQLEERLDRIESLLGELPEGQRQPEEAPRSDDSAASRTRER
jgi:hypothetical protein